MINYQMTPLMITEIFGRVRTVHLTIKEVFDTLNIPLISLNTGDQLDEQTSATIFEHFPIQCDHYGSSTAFYQAYYVLNYFITVLEYSTRNNIVYNQLVISFEDMLIINSFSIFKDLK